MNVVYEWLTTVDHKKIGLMYIVYALIFLVIAGFQAILMRIQLAVPNNHFVSPQVFNQLFTMHGTTMVFFVGMPIFELGGVALSGLQGLMTARVTPSEQGRLQGANGVLGSLTTMIGPIVFAWVFAHSVSDWSSFAPPGLAFYAAAAAMAAAFVLALGVRATTPSPD